MNESKRRVRLRAAIQMKNALVCRQSETAVLGQEGTDVVT
jgi:hypothetical protein